MATKILGYVLAILGIIGLAAWAIPEVKGMIPSIDLLSDMQLLIASIVLAVVGVFFAFKGRSRTSKGMEVPIYRGKNIVGYRRN